MGLRVRRKKEKTYKTLPPRLVRRIVSRKIKNEKKEKKTTTTEPWFARVRTRRRSTENRVPLPAARTAP